MGLWNDTVAETDYNNLPLEERKKVREAYIKKASAFHPIEVLEKTIKDSGGYDKETPSEDAVIAAEPARLAAEQKLLDEQNPEKILETGHNPDGSYYEIKSRRKIAGENIPKYMDGTEVLSSGTIPQEGKSVERMAAEAIAPWNASGALPDEIVIQNAKESELNPINAGFRNSLIAAYMNGLPTAEKKEAVQQAVERARQRYEASVADKSLPGKILYRTAEGIGQMLGSPLTYVAPFAGKVLGLAGNAAKVAPAVTREVVPLAMGAAGGLENVASANRRGEDVNAGEEVLRGMATMGIGSALGKGASSLSRNAAKNLGDVAKDAISAGSEAAGYGVANAAVGLASGQSLDEAAIGMAAGALQGIPSMVGQRTAAAESNNQLRKQTPEPENRVFIKNIVNTQLQYDRARQTDPVLQIPGASINPKYLNDRKVFGIFNESEKATQNKERSGRGVKKATLELGKSFVDTQYKAISYLDGYVKREKKALIESEIDKLGITDEKQRKIARRKLDDKYNQGGLETPGAAKYKRLLLAEPTEIQTAIYDANAIDDEIYKDMSPKEVLLTNQYLTAKNLISVFDRTQSRKAGKTERNYILPEGMTEEGLRRTINEVENNPQYADIVPKAMQAWDAFRKTLDRQLKAGMITQEQYNDISSTESYVPIVHIAKETPYAEKGINTKEAGEGDLTKRIQGGSRLPINMNVGELLNHALVKTRMAELKHERLGVLYDMAKSGNYGELRLGDEHGKPATGETKITYKENGIEKEIIAPIWFKQSIEQNGVDGASMGMKAAGWILGGIPLKKLAVQWNPEFAVSNFARDWQRYYRLQSIAGRQSDSLGQRLWDSNPAKYAAEMSKALYDISGKDFAAYREMAMRNNALRGRITAEYNADPYASKTKKRLRKIDAMLGIFGSTSEDMMRVASFKMLMDKGFTAAKAGEAVGEFLDYNRKGTMSGVMDKIVPFFNVAIQAPRADIKVAKTRPADYAMRVGWNVLGAVLASFGARSIVGDDLIKETNGTDRSNNALFPFPRTDTKQPIRYAKVPLDQQDRLLWAIGDLIAGGVKGHPVDWDRLKNAGFDFMSLPLQFRQYIAPTAQAVLAFSGYNKNMYTGEKLSYVKEIEGNNKHLQYDVTRDPSYSIIASQALYNMSGGVIDIQPAMLLHGIKTVLPAGFLQKTVGTIYNSMNDEEIKMAGIPIVSKMVGDSDVMKPVYKSIEVGKQIKGIKAGEEYNARRIRSKMTSEDDFRSSIISAIQEAASRNDDAKIQSLEGELKTGILLRRSGLDPRILSSVVMSDPSQLPFIDSEVKKATGKSIFDHIPTLKKSLLYRAQNNDSSE